MKGTYAKILGAAALMTAPRSASAATFKEIVENSIVPLGDLVITLLYLIAFAGFLFGVFRYFFTQGEEGRAKGKQLMFWGIIALAVLFAVWGFVRLLLGVLTDWA